MANTIKVNGKTISYSKTAVTTNTITFSDGIEATVIGSVANVEVLKAYIAKKAEQVTVSTPITAPTPAAHVPAVDNTYLAKNAVLKPDGSVKSIPDSSGKNPLNYVGVANPILTGKPPIFWNGEIQFDNEPNANFASDQFDKIVDYPYEVTLVGRRLPGTAYEQYMNDWNGDLTIGDGGNVLRAGDGNLPDQAFSNSAINNFEVFVIHVLAESGKQTMWLNGKLLGSIKSRTKSRKVLNSIGVDTNNAQWNYIAEYIKLSKFTDIERASHLASVMQDFKQGSLPDSPFASDVDFAKQNAGYTAIYKYNGSLPQDTGKTEYKWRGLIESEGLGKVKLIGTNAILPIDAAKQYDSIRCEVKVYDIQGKSFRFVSMEFKEF